MISFKLISDLVAEELLGEIEEQNPDAEIEYASDIIRLLSEQDDDTEYAVSFSRGCLLVRCYDGEYSFSYPTPLCDLADTVAASLDVRDYAVKEEIPLVFYDIPAEELGSILPLFRHVNLDSEDEENLYYRARLMSELSLIDEMPEYYGFFGIGLTPLTEEDDEDYTRLCTDRETNALWGYDYSADEPNPDKDYFRRTAEAEYYRGTSLSLAVREGGRFIGEAVLYYFDLEGGCECAIRLLPEYRGRGYATEALRCLKTLARRMGVIRLRAKVDAANAASIRMTEKVLPEIDRNEEFVLFEGRIVNIN